MDYTQEQLDNIEKCATVYLPITDIALIIEVDPNELRADIASEGSEARRKYLRGKAISKLQLHEQEMQLAKVGSPLALENAHRNLMDMEDDE